MSNEFFIENKLDVLIFNNVRFIDTDNLKTLWDSDLLDDSGLALRAIHNELNIRGDGEYFAV